MDYNELAAQEKRYRYFAYLVIRDAIGFYFGIPKFLNEDNLKTTIILAFSEKIKQVKKQKNRELTPKEINRCLFSVRKSLAARIKELEDDFENCEKLLFEDNHWLQLLDLNESFFRNYFKSLNEQTKDKLAIVPKWKTRDHSLGRPYINDNFGNNVSF